jgi:hypothetical protein
MAAVMATVTAGRPGLGVVIASVLTGG